MSTALNTLKIEVTANGGIADLPINFSWLSIIDIKGGTKIDISIDNEVAGTFQAGFQINSARARQLKLINKSSDDVVVDCILSQNEVRDNRLSLQGVINTRQVDGENFKISQVDGENFKISQVDGENFRVCNAVKSATFLKYEYNNEIISVAISVSTSDCLVLNFQNDTDVDLFLGHLNGLRIPAGGSYCGLWKGQINYYSNDILATGVIRIMRQIT